MKGRAPRKILHIVQDLKIGGLERVLASIALSLNRSKYAVQVWCLAGGGDVAQALTEKGMSVRILGMKSYYNPLAVVRLSRLMRRERFHLIHTHGYFAGTFGRFAAICAGIPVLIAHVHSTYYGYSKRNLLIERILSHFTDRIICISQAVERFVTINERIHQDKTCLIYNAVERPADDPDDNSKENLRDSLGISQEAVVITIVASLTTNKGHGLLLEAMGRVLACHPLTRLVIVGDGPLRTQLETEARRLEIAKSIVFTGTRKDVFPLLWMSDICGLTSQAREGLGVALIEAMAANLPVVGTDVGGIPELICDGENGFLVPPGSPGPLADAIGKLVENRELRVRMGHKGRDIYEKQFTLPRMTQQIEALYDQLLEGKGRASLS
jgi:glycosyltransferase involved in cell wall biosynthesis